MPETENVDPLELLTQVLVQLSTHDSRGRLVARCSTLAWVRYVAEATGAA
jgi:hypothetical protein